MHKRPLLRVVRDAVSLKSPLSRNFIQLEQPRVWSLPRLRLDVSKAEWYFCHSEADSFGGSLVHMLIPLQTSLRLQKETGSSLPAIMLCNSGGNLSNRDLLSRISAFSVKREIHVICSPVLH